MAAGLAAKGKTEPFKTKTPGKTKKHVSPGAKKRTQGDRALGQSDACFSFHCLNLGELH